MYSDVIWVRNFGSSGLSEYHPVNLPQVYHLVSPKKAHGMPNKIGPRGLIARGAAFAVCLFLRPMPNKPTWLSSPLLLPSKIKENRPCRDNEMPPTSLQRNTNHLITSPLWFSLSRQKAHEMSSSSRVREPLRPSATHDLTGYYFTRDKQGITRLGSRIPRLGSRQAHPRTRESHRVA
jgi:hypothetical protein